MMSIKGHQMDEINLNQKNKYPQASHDPYEDEDVAQQKRRKERLRRKKQKRREKPELEDGDLDALLDDQSGQSKKTKNRKKKNGSSNLWYDDRYDDESNELWQSDYDFGEYDEDDE